MSDLSELKTATMKHFDDDKDSFGGIERTLKGIALSFTNHAQSFNDYRIDQEKTHDVIKGEYMELKMAIHELKEQQAPINLWFQNFSFGKKALIGLMGVIGSIVAIAIGIKNLLK